MNLNLKQKSKSKIQKRKKRVSNSQVTDTLKKRKKLTNPSSLAKRPQNLIGQTDQEPISLLCNLIAMESITINIIPKLKRLRSFHMRYQRSLSNREDQKTNGLEILTTATLEDTLMSMAKVLEFNQVTSIKVSEPIWTLTELTQRESYQILQFNGRWQLRNSNIKNPNKSTEQMLTDSSRMIWHKFKLSRMSSLNTSETTLFKILSCLLLNSNRIYI